MSPFEFVLALLFIVVGLPVICGTYVSIKKMGLGKQARGSAPLDAEETRIMQEIHQSLGRLEERIEALETIILDKEKQ